MFTVDQLTELGAEVVAGRVIFNREIVDGVWTKKGFEPVEGGPLDGAEVKKPAAKTAKKGEATQAATESTETQKAE